MADKQIKEARAALSEKATSRPCPMCGDTQWRFYVSTKDGGPMVVMTNSYGSESIDNFLEVLGLACAHCGFIALHDVKLAINGKRSDAPG